jgi:drug/metabolite transporter (DMT)-like permease
MAVLLALLAAAGYGAGDFAAGLASRRFASGPVAAVTQTLGLVIVAVALLIFPGSGPSAPALWWGAASGLGSAVGALALYRGLASGQMSVVAAVSAVLSAVIPTIVGLALGDRLTVGAATGIVIAVPAIAMVSWQPGAADPRAARAGLLYGGIAGLGFALLFIALDRAGTRAGAWPLLPGQVVAVLLVLPVARRGLAGVGRPSRGASGLMVGAGILSGIASLLFLAATGHGQLAIVAVLTAMYPAVTILLSRTLLAERWSRVQGAGLVTAATAIVLVSVS